MVNRKCPKCEAVFDRKSNFEFHINRKYECKPSKNNELVLCGFVQNNAESNIANTPDKNKELVDIKDNDLCCGFCSKLYSSKSNLNKHLKVCKAKKESNLEKENIFKLSLEKDKQYKEELKQHKEEIEELKKQNKFLTDKINKLINMNMNSKTNNNINQITKIHETMKKMEKTIPANTNLNVNNQLLEQIIQKDKKIDELVKISKSQNNNNLELVGEIKEFEELEKIKVDKLEVEEKPMTLILNNDIIECRKSDGYINATQLCKAGGKKFYDWSILETTKTLINTLSFKAGIPALNLINKTAGGNHSGTWIHPDLAIQLAQWISADFAL